jgi:dolichol-phosphate mannosyltransferase
MLTPPNPLPVARTITVVVPVFNESDAIEHHLPVILDELRRLSKQGLPGVLLVVDDGSTDDTAAKVQALSERCAAVELLCLSRNFGKEAAIHAGLCYARGDAVIVMDSDLQHPPALIPQMVEGWLNGLAVVEACKASRGDESLLSRWLVRGFYRMFGALTDLDIRNHSDFKLLDRQVVDAYCQLPERQRFFRGLIAWMGFPTGQLFFDVPQRRQGRSAWSRLKLLRLSLTALTSFTCKPLHLVTVLGLCGFAISVIIGAIALYDKFSGHAVSGFTTVILLILLIGSLVLFGQGLIGIYIEQIFNEIKQRPTFLMNRQKSRLRKE